MSVGTEGASSPMSTVAEDAGPSPAPAPKRRKAQINIIMKTYIINPDNGKKTTLDEWRKDSDPTRATVLAIETDDDHLLLISKSYLPGRYDFEGAQKACADFKPEGLESITFRAPTRKETLDIYDARFLGGLDEAIELTKGNYAKAPSNLFWTSERDADPRYGASVAWYANGNYGCLYNSSLCNSNLAVPVALLK